MAACNDVGHARLGLAVSRKVSRKAVVRNRIKRCTREVFRLHHQDLCALDFVVVAYPESVRATGRELSEAFLQLAKKMCRTCAKS